jgi:hypothetical protein
MKKAQSQGSSKKQTMPTAALHTHDGKETHGFAIINLHVLIQNDDGSWFAQGLEIDYAAEGATIEDAKTNFENGLSATIFEHIKVYGHFWGVLKPAPEEAWRTWWAATKNKLVFTCGVVKILAPTGKDMPVSADVPFTALPVEYVTEPVLA